MLKSSIFRVVDFCTRYSWWVIVVAVALAAASTVYTTRHFAIKTDVKDLFPSDLPWTQRAFDYMKAFPQPDILVVVDAPTPELVDQASSKLAHALGEKSNLIRAVHLPQSGSFFDQNGLLYLPRSDVERLTDGLVQADPILQKLAADPSLKGALGALSLGVMGVQFGALQLGRAVTVAIAQTARDLELNSDYQARARLTGLAPMNDDQFATIKDNAPLNAVVSIVAVFIILWLALHAARIIMAVAVTLVVGLAISAAFGLLLVGALNVISVAFFVLFVGLGVDFGLQFSVRYRAERHDYGDLRAALRSAAGKAGAPLALAAAATAVGFSSFLPTAYRGLSELGQIAGSGMIIAFLTSITLLPALLM